MTLAQRGATQQGGANAANFTITKPTGVVSGDFLVCWVVVDAGSAITITGPSGWTKSRDDNDGGAFGIGLQCWTKLAGGSEPANYTWTNNGDVAYTLIAASGGDATNVLDGAGNGTVVSGVAGTTTSAPTTTPTVATDWDCRAYCIDGGASSVAADTLTLPAGYTQFGTNQTSGGNLAKLAVGFKVLASTAATGAQSATNTSRGLRVGQSVLVKDSAGGAADRVKPAMLGGKVIGGDNTAAGIWG